MRIPENLIHQIWKNQFFNLSNLHTTENKKVQIFSTGIINKNSGADFRNAHISIDGVSTIGNIEIHCYTSDWEKHTHNQNPKYDDVILHVVLYHDKNLSHTLPVLELQHFLNDDFHNIIYKCIQLEYTTESKHKIPCHPLCLDVSFSEKIILLEKLAIQRMQRKSDMLFEKSIRYDAVIFRGILTALGYKENTSQMNELASRIKYSDIEFVFQLDYQERRMYLEAILFHLAGFLSLSIEENDTRLYLEKLQSTLYKTSFNSIKPMEVSVWSFFRLRPFNFPTLRIAGFCEILAKHSPKSIMEQAIAIISSSERITKKTSELETLFLSDANGFWREHYHFQNKSNNQITSLVGKSRASEIVLNVMLPIVYSYSETTKHDELKEKVLALYKDYPKTIQASVSVEMIQSFLGDEATIKSGYIEQGLLELKNNYCNTFSCLQCEIGKKILFEP